MDQAVKLCGRCMARPKKPHFNSQWCHPCAEELKRRPAHRLTAAQIREVKRRLWKMPKAQICQEVGISWSSLGRWARDEGVRVAYFNRWAANPNLVNQVCNFYAKHGRQKTEERFPGVRVRSVVEHYQHEPRQIRWTESQVRELAMMAGLVSHEAQARYFARPRANAGSIKSAWMKRFRQNGSQINGLSWNQARHLVGAKCRPIRTAFWSQRPGSKRGNFSRRLVLWVDLERHLLREAPTWLAEASRSMARFQRWLHGTDDVRPKVIRMIRELEQ